MNTNIIALNKGGFLPISTRFCTCRSVPGGIREPSLAAMSVRAGASAIVIGTAFEEGPDAGLVREFAAAVHDQAIALPLIL